MSWFIYSGGQDGMGRERFRWGRTVQITMAPLGLWGFWGLDMHLGLILALFYIMT